MKNRAGRLKRKMPVLLPDEVLEKVERLFTVLSSGTRLRLLLAICDAGELTVTEIVQRSGMKFTAVSNQLRLMTDRGVVEVRKEGNYSYYSVSDGAAIRILRHCASLVANNGSGANGSKHSRRLSLAFGGCCAVVAAFAVASFTQPEPETTMNKTASETARTFTDGSDHMAVMEECIWRHACGDTTLARGGLYRLSGLYSADNQLAGFHLRGTDEQGVIAWPEKDAAVACNPLQK